MAGPGQQPGRLRVPVSGMAVLGVPLTHRAWCMQSRELLAGVSGALCLPLHCSAGLSGCGVTVGR